MEPPSLASPSLPNTSSSPLQGYLSSEDAHDDDPPPSSPPPDVPRVPEWACDAVTAVGPLAGDPSDSCRTRAWTSGIGLLSHAIFDDPQSFS